VAGLQRPGRSISSSRPRTGKTCPCRSPGCGSWGPGPNSALRWAASIPQTQQATGSVEKIRLSETSPAGAGGGAANNYWLSKLGLAASWELDFWGKFRRAVESADASLFATVADYDNVLVSLTGDVATTYILLRTLEQRLRIARENVEVQKESLRIARARFEGGTTSMRDVEQALTVLESTEATIPTLTSLVQQSQKRPQRADGDAPQRPGRFSGEAIGHPGAAPPGGGGHPGRSVAPAARHPERRVAGRGPMRPDRRGQGRALPGLLPQRLLWRRGRQRRQRTPWGTCSSGGATPARWARPSNGIFSTTAASSTR
jgi:hypothetical protein